MEIYSHPTTGIDPEQFEYLLEQGGIAACLLMPVNHYPTGVTYSQETMRRIVEAAAARGVPIIENDLLGELSHSVPVAPTLNFKPAPFRLRPPPSVRPAPAASSP
jgi:DNA-binding transcriptional MocR family regulator